MYKHKNTNNKKIRSCSELEKGKFEAAQSK